MKYKYASIDVETLGLDPETCSLIEIGIVLDDLVTPIDKLPRYHKYIANNTYSGDLTAINMHKLTLTSYLHDHKGDDWYIKNVVHINQLTDSVANWLFSFKKDSNITGFTVAGKNFGSFDSRFLAKVPYWNQYIKLKHRYLDPGCLYFDPKIDFEIPNLKECLRRAGIEKEIAHNALEDALDVVTVIRSYYGNRSVL